MVKIEYTSSFVFSYEIATELSNEWTKAFKDYNTAIKKELSETENCWVVTNRYDPSVVAQKEIKNG